MKTIDIDTYVNYLDDNIRYWRNIRDNVEQPPPTIDPEKYKEMSIYYIDAFQCARNALTGSLLSTEK